MCAYEEVEITVHKRMTCIWNNNMPIIKEKAIDFAQKLGFIDNIHISNYIHN